MSTLLIILLGIFFISGAPLFTIMLAATALGAFFSVRGFEAGFDGAINKLFGTSGRDEMEVLFTFLAHRYEHRSVLLTSNLVFREWDKIFGSS